MKAISENGFQSARHCPRTSSMESGGFWREIFLSWATCRGQPRQPLLHLHELMLPPQSVRRTLIFCAIATAFCSAVFGQGVSPQGSEFPLSGPLDGDQVRPSLGLNSSGGWLVWQDGRIDTNGQGIAALRLDSGFYSEVAAIRVNEEQRGHQQNPQVAVLSDGGAAVIWSSAWKDKKGRGTNGIFARFLGADGTFKTGDVLVNQVSRRILTNYSQTLPGYKNNKMASRKFRFSETFRIYRGLNEGASIAALPDGGAVVAYSGLRRSITKSQQFVREVKVIRGISYTNDVVRSATTTANWQKDVFFQRFDATAKQVGGEVVVNQFALLDQHQPVVAALPSGNFVVAYVSERTVLRVFGETFYRIDRPTPVPRVDINARIFDATGAPVGGEFTVNTGSVQCATPAIAAGADGAFTIAWVQTDGSKANTVDVYARTFNADGSSTLDAFLVNAYQRGAQHTPRVAALGAVQMIVWNSRGQDGSGEGIFGRLISAGAPDGRRVSSQHDHRRPAASSRNCGGWRESFPCGVVGIRIGQQLRSVCPDLRRHSANTFWSESCGTKQPAHRHPGIRRSGGCDRYGCSHGHYGGWNPQPAASHGERSRRSCEPPMDGAVWRALPGRALGGFARLVADRRRAHRSE